MKNETALVSIVIPVFNTENYLTDCLNSICLQTYSNFQVILVNDASTDGSLKIIRNFSEKDNRFILVNLENNVGRSQARNKALENITGDFVVFIDSDDILEPNYLDVLVSAAINNNADIVVCNYRLFSTNNGDLVNPENFTEGIQVTEAGVFFRSVFSLQLDQKLVTGGFLWNKLISKRVLAEGRFFDTEGAEDEFFFYLLKKNIKTVVFVPDFLYRYRQRSDSVSQGTPRKSFLARTVVSRFELLKQSEDENEALLAHTFCIQVCIFFVLSTILHRNVSSKDISLCLPYCQQALVWLNQGQYLPIISKKFLKFKSILVLAKIPNCWFLLYFFVNRVIHFYKIWQFLK